MRIAIIIMLIFIFIVPVLGKTEVYIKLDKDRVAIGDWIRINVSVFCGLPSPIEVLILGSGVGEWLYENDSRVQKFSNSWDFQIPEDWLEGIYVVKVNVIENSTTREFFEQFRVVKPKILSIDFPEVPYQGRTLVNVAVETADENKTSLSFKLIGLNFRFVSKEEFKPYKNLTKIKLNLRERFEETRDIDYVLKPGIYAMEFLLKYDNKIFDTRIVTFEVVKPKISVKVPEEVVIGNPIRITISTNRVNDTFDGASYSGIVLTLVGDNYKAVKVIELDEKGQANITMETVGLSEGDYKLYIRDTGMTFKENDIKEFALLYYDLEPKDPKANQYYAQDDVLVVRDLKITKSKQSKTNSILFFEPNDLIVSRGDIAEYKILISSAENGLSAYDLDFYISNRSVAEFYDVDTPEWAYEIHKLISGDYLKLRVLDLKDGVNDGSKRVELATIRIKALYEGFTEITVRVNRFDSDNGTPLNPYAYGAYLFVNPLQLEEIDQLEGMINSSEKLDAQILEIQELERQYDQITELINSTNSYLIEVEENKSLKIPEGKSSILKPKEIETELKDIILMLGLSVTFILVIGRIRFAR